MSDYKNIFLIGMPGAGKSTMGLRLAGALGREFIDLDDLIEEHMDMSISAIFSDLGETRFRIAEQRALQSVLPAAGLVIGTGGGTSCFYDNMELMNKHGVTLFLDPPLEVLVSRIMVDLKERPKLQGADSLKEVLQRTYASRLRYYEKAHIRVTDPEVTPEEIGVMLESKTNS